MIWEILDRQTDIAALCQDLAVRRLYVFGARRQGAGPARVEDLDFLVEFWPMGPEVYADTYLCLGEALQGILGAPVNLLDTEMLDNPFLERVVERSGVLIYEPF